MEEKKLRKLDLGCGDRKKEGFEGVDISNIPGVDVVHDLTKMPYPFENESVEEIFSCHFLEHLDGPERIKFMEECWRILVPGGKMTIIVPYYASMRAIQDPTHKFPPIAESSFVYFNKQWIKDNKLEHYNINADFDFTYGYNMFPNWNNRSDDSKIFASSHYNNVVSDLQVVLTKRK